MSNKEIKEALELIGDADTSSANYHLLEHEQKKALARIENRAPEWLRAQRTIIEEQASSLNLAIKALKRIEDFWEVNTTVKTYARDALSEIRRTNP